MNRSDYRAAFDAIPFHQDFQHRTIQALRRAAGQPEKKEFRMMKTKKIAIVAAALSALLVVSAAAAVLFLSPRDVAEHISDPILAEAFDSPGAVIMDTSVESEGRRITLAGLVSGKGLSHWCSDVDEARTYVVASVTKIDGTPMDDEEMSAMTFTPLVSGYAPNVVNAWTLGGGRVSFLQDGVAYYAFDCRSLEMFADHVVYMAAYQGTTAPSRDMFQMDTEGVVTYTDSVSGPRALFSLPLDESKADPAAVEAFLNDLGMEPHW